jgi:hypothetical protein
MSRLKDKIIHWSKGLRTYVGIGLTMWVSPAIRDANLNIEVGPVKLPVAQLVDIIGGMLMGVGGASKLAAYQQARAGGSGKMEALGKATMQGPILGPALGRVNDAMKKLRGAKTSQ